MPDLSTILSSTLLAALVAALVSLQTIERRISIENVTKERAKWRAAMRKVADTIINAARKGQSDVVEQGSAQLALNVNPFHSEDIALVLAAKNLAAPTDLEAQILEFVDRMALLLKHDWERAKREAKPWYLFPSATDRVTYENFKNPAVLPQLSAPNEPSRTWALTGFFTTLSLAAGFLFFIAAGLTEPFQNLVRLFNDPKVAKSTGEWIQFALLSIICGSMWSAAYLWFKASEKRFLEIWFKK